MQWYWVKMLTTQDWEKWCAAENIPATAKEKMEKKAAFTPHPKLIKMPYQKCLTCDENVMIINHRDYGHIWRTQSPLGDNHIPQFCHTCAAQLDHFISQEIEQSGNDQLQKSRAVLIPYMRYSKESRQELLRHLVSQFVIDFLNQSTRRFIIQQRSRTHE